MLWFQTRHSKSSFLFPFLSRVWVLSRHIIGSAWFLFHSRALSKVSDIYIVSFIPRLARPSFQRPPPTCEISALWQADSDSRPIQESPRAWWDEGGKTKRIRSTVSALYGHFNTDLTSVNRGTNDISDDYPGTSESWPVDFFSCFFLQLLCRCI